MKTHILSLVIVFLLPSTLVPAQGPGGPANGHMSGPGALSSVRGPGSGISSLEHFLSMDDDQLAQLEALIRRIRQMTPAEREAYLDKVRQYQKMPPEEQQNLQLTWGRMDQKVRQAWREYMLSLEEDKREAVRLRMQEIPFEERSRWRLEQLIEAGLITEDEVRIPGQ